MLFSLVKLENCFCEERKKREKNASLNQKASHYILMQYLGILIADSKMGINMLEIGEKPGKNYLVK